MRAGLPERSPLRLIGRCALCGFWLVAALPAAILPLILIINGLGLESILPEAALMGITAAGLLAVHALAGAGWGWNLARLAGYANRRRIAWFAALGFGLATMLAFLALTEIEQSLRDLRFTLGLRTHHIFLIAFTLATFLVAGASWLGVGLGTGDRRLTMRLAPAGGLTGALTFAAAALIFDAAGFRVGALGAEQRATMVLVSVSGVWLAALVGSAVGGTLLAAYAQRRQRAALPHLSS